MGGFFNDQLAKYNVALCEDVSKFSATWRRQQNHGKFNKKVDVSGHSDGVSIDKCGWQNETNKTGKLWEIEASLWVKGVADRKMLTSVIGSLKRLVLITS